MSKQKKIKDYRQQFINQGYAIVENVLTTEEVEEGSIMLLDKILQSLMPVSGEHDGNSRCPSIVFLKSLALPHIRNYWKSYRT